MAQTSGFFNAQLNNQGEFDRVYLAEQFAAYFSNFIGNGVFAHLLNKFVVTEGTGLSVNVGTGKAFCEGFWFESDAQETLSIGLPNDLLNRKDNIVIRFDFENRETSIMVIQGEAAISPVAPDIVRTSLVFDLKIAEIFVAASSSSIVQKNITDTRSDNVVCGWVTGLVDQVDTSDLFLQYSAAYAQWQNQMQSDEAAFTSKFNSWLASQRNAFDAWMSTLTGELNVDGYVNIDERKFKGQLVGDIITFSPTDFDNFKKIDFAEVFVNGLRVQTFLSNDSIPTTISSTFAVDDYFAAVDFQQGDVTVFYAKVLGANNFERVILSDDNEILVRVGQFKKGVRP